jgi:hypothetical protein
MNGGDVQKKIPAAKPQGIEDFSLKIFAYAGGLNPF